ncbi:hypothetical protein ABOONEI_1945 [Aciduliprofundum boonei T469]|nr:hypothetical protein ABOONEI_2564 [Aciduliprofundum boonei T469]EDY37024.1 hypothetical protein ABOONEI_1945 [Aciduliprofundum boonei T469]
MGNSLGDIKISPKLFQVNFKKLKFILPSYLSKWLTNCSKKLIYSGME